MAPNPGIAANVSRERLFLLSAQACYRRRRGPLYILICRVPCGSSCEAERPAIETYRVPRTASLLYGVPDNALAYPTSIGDLPVGAGNVPSVTV